MCTDRNLMFLGARLVGRVEAAGEQEERITTNEKTWVYAKSHGGPSGTDLILINLFSVGHMPGKWCIH